MVIQLDEPVEVTVTEPAKLPSERSGIAMDDQELIAAVIPHLAIPEHFVQASQDHANKVHEKHSKEGVQAYAKLAGKDWTFYVKKLKNNIGRPPEGSTAVLPHAASDQVDSGTDAEDESRVHVDLGPNKMISRLHAEIFFESDSERWSIIVNGRNGIRVNGNPLRRGEQKPLDNGEVIEVGGVEMMFVLPEPDGSLTIDKKYLQRAGLIQKNDDDTQEESGPLHSSGPTSSSQVHSRGQNGAAVAIAPAPPDYRRPETPVSARTKAPYSTGKSPYTNGGTMLMNSDDVDLSLEQNQHIKPSYSYAQMISQAILDTEDEKLNLAGIYTFIMEKYAYYRFQNPAGWQVSLFQHGQDVLY